MLCCTFPDIPIHFVNIPQLYIMLCCTLWDPLLDCVTYYLTLCNALLHIAWHPLPLCEYPLTLCHALLHTVRPPTTFCDILPNSTSCSVAHCLTSPSTLSKFPNTGWSRPSSTIPSPLLSTVRHEGHPVGCLVRAPGHCQGSSQRRSRHALQQ